MDGYAGAPNSATVDQSAAEEIVLATRRVMYQHHPIRLLPFERGGTMREHIETLIVALGDALRPSPTTHSASTVEPRRRRPRRARATYIPVRHDGATARFAH